MRARLRRLAALSFGDWCTLIQASVLLLWVDFALRSRGFAKVYQQFQGGEPMTCISGATQFDFELVDHYTMLVNLAGRCYPRPARCLHRSLALAWLLRRRGLPAQLQIGVSKAGTGLRAHAWLEIDGRLMNDSVWRVASYTKLDLGHEEYTEHNRRDLPAYRAAG